MVMTKLVPSSAIDVTVDKDNQAENETEKVCFIRYLVIILKSWCVTIPFTCIIVIMPICRNEGVFSTSVKWYFLSIRCLAYNFIIIHFLFERSSQKWAEENWWNFYQLLLHCFLLVTYSQRRLFPFLVDLRVAYHTMLLVSSIVTADKILF